MQMTKHNFPVMYSVCKRKLNWSEVLSLRPKEMVFVKVLYDNGTYEYVRANYCDNLITLRDISQFCMGLEFNGVKVEREDFIIG